MSHENTQLVREVNQQPEPENLGTYYVEQDAALVHPTERYLYKGFGPVFLSVIPDGKTEKSLQNLKVLKAQIGAGLRELHAQGQLPEGVDPNILTEELVGANAQPVTLEAFQGYSEPLRKFILEKVLGSTPTIMQPYSDIGNDRRGLVNYRVSDYTSRFRGVGLVHFNKRYVALVEGRNASMAKWFDDKARETMNPIFVLDLQEDLTLLSIEDIAKTLFRRSEEYRDKVIEHNRRNPQRMLPVVVLDETAIKQSLEAIIFDLPYTSKERNFPTVPEFSARNTILWIVNETATEAPISTLAWLATAGTQRETRRDQFADFDYSDYFLELRLRREVQWGHLMAAFLNKDGKPSWLQLHILNRLVEVANSYKRLVESEEQAYGDVRDEMLKLAHAEATNRANLRLRELQNDTLLLEQQTQSAAYLEDRGHDVRMAQLEAGAIEEEAALNAEEALYTARIETAREWWNQFQDQLVQYKQDHSDFLLEMGNKLLLMQGDHDRQMAEELSKRFLRAANISQQNQYLFAEPNLNEVEINMLVDGIRNNELPTMPQLPSSIPDIAKDDIIIVTE